MPPEIVANEIITKPHARIISPSKTVTSPHKILAKDMEDLIHLQGPLTEDAVMRTLQARFNEKKYFVSKLHHEIHEIIIDVSALCRPASFGTFSIWFEHCTFHSFALIQARNPICSENAQKIRKSYISATFKLYNYNALT